MLQNFCGIGDLPAKRAALVEWVGGATAAQLLDNHLDGKFVDLFAAKLRVDAASLRSEYRKQYKGNLAAGFLNWDELQAAIGSMTPLGEGPAPTIPLRELQPAG